MRWKEAIEQLLWMSKGREFQIVGAATEKLLEPKHVRSWLVSTCQRWPKKDRRHRRIVSDRSGWPIQDRTTSLDITSVHQSQASDPISIIQTITNYRPKQHTHSQSAEYHHIALLAFWKKTSWKRLQQHRNVHFPDVATYSMTWLSWRPQKTFRELPEWYLLQVRWPFYWTTNSVTALYKKNTKTMVKVHAGMMTIELLIYNIQF